MPDISKIKAGQKIEFQDQPFEVLKATFSKIGRQGAVLRAKLKNLKTGAASEHTFRDSDKLEEPELDRQKAQFLYREDDLFYFMDLKSYDQFSLSKSALGPLTHFLIDGLETEIIYYKEEPINIDLPIKLDFLVVEAPPAIRGDTADGGGNKKVKIETGWELNVPIFIKKGDKIKINTREGTYVSRV